MLKLTDLTHSALPEITQPVSESELPSSVAKRVKRSVLSAFGAVGGFNLVKASRWRTSRLLVLGYHGVSLYDEHLWEPALFLSPGRFARRMELLRERGYFVIGLDEGLARLAAGNLPPASVALTFDDGLYCFHKVALPILERLNLPATLYFTTFYSEFQEPVFDVLCSYVLWKSRSRRLDLKSLTGDDGTFDLGNACQRQAAEAAILRYASRENLSARDKVHFGERLAFELAFDLDFVKENRLFSLMTADEVADASSRGVSVELHTHRHRVPLERTAFLREIDENRLRIQKMTGRSSVHFCYPSGYYSQALVPWLRESRIQSATTCDPGLVSAATPAMVVPRLIDVSSLAESEFEGWLCGASAFLPSRHRELPLESRRPAEFVARTESVCRDALRSPGLMEITTKLREYDPSGKARLEWLRALWTRGAFPAEAQAAITAARAVAGKADFGFERVLLLEAALGSLDRLTDARLDLATQALVCNQYEFFVNPGEDWRHRFDSSSYSYRAYAGMSLLDRIPAGRLDWEISGIPRSWIPKIRRRDLPRVLRAIATKIGGFKPVVFTHLAFRQTPFATLRESDVNASYLRIARCLALRPELKAIVTASWFYSAETHRVSPHLRWTTRMFEENGGIVSDLGRCPEDAGFLVGSIERQKLYESGDYKPTEGVILWPRRAVLEWLSKQPDAAS
ncbi:MAG: polysaccharide deacetylase family protein [Bryobacteraceae bacterium]|jgi:peptidoglycan/xylan/chitin deacetylase (PgdA/CDA1 family)